MGKTLVAAAGAGLAVGAGAIGHLAHTPKADYGNLFFDLMTENVGSWASTLMGLMVLTILVKVSTISREVTPLANFLTSHGLGLAMIPLAWALLAAAFGQRGRLAGQCATVSGILLAVAIAVVFTIAILRPAT